MSTCVIRRVLWIALAVAVLGQVARADEIDTITVRQVTVPGFTPPGDSDDLPSNDVLWLIVGEREDFFNILPGVTSLQRNLPDIFELFRIDPVPGETFVHEFFPGSLIEFRIEYPTTLPVGIDLSSTVAIPEAPEPTATPEPATLGMLGSGLVMMAWWIRRKDRNA